MFVPVQAQTTIENDELVKSSQSSIDKWKENGGFLFGFAASGTGAYISIDDPLFGNNTGMGYGGEAEIPLLFQTSSRSGFLGYFGLAASIGINGRQISLDVEEDTKTIQGFYTEYTVPFRAGLFINILTFDSDSIFSFLGSGISLKGYYNRSYSMNHLKMKLQVTEGLTKGLTRYKEEKNSDFSDHAYGLEILFASTKADFDKFIKTPSFKIDIFILPSNPFIAAVNLGVAVFY